MSAEFQREPMAIESFPPNLQMHVKPDAPAKMKMMAAQGMVPAPPAQQVLVLYQLHFEDQFRDNVAEAIKGMPPNVLGSIVADQQPPGLLDWLGEVLEDEALLESLILNGATTDHTILAMAERVTGKLGEIIANNQVRVLRTPAIIEALYKNPDVRMGTVDKLIELAQRNQVDLSAFSQLQSAMEAAGTDSEPGLDDDEFAAMLREEQSMVSEENKALAQLEDDGLTRSQREKLQEELAREEEEGGRAGTIRQKIAKMNIAQKIRLSTVGSREAIKILIRDPNKLIHMAAIRSPRIKLGDVKRLSSNKSLPDGVITYIAKNRQWSSDYEVLVNLTMNPKTPLSEVTGFLKHLRKRELQQVSKNRNISHQVSRLAKRMMKQRR